jgi:DNA-binding CsgD family transcriptional regulator
MVRMLSKQGELVLLSPRETEVLALLVNGYLNKEISYELGIELTTAKAHVARLKEGLALKNRAQIVAWAVSRPEVFEGQAVSTGPYRLLARCATMVQTLSLSASRS